MNILIISPQMYPCNTGGVEIFNYYIIEELAKKGQKIWVLTNCEYNFKNKNIIVIKLNKKFLINHTISNLFHILLEIIILKKQIDIIHIPYTNNSILAYPILLVKIVFNINYIITIHSGRMYPWKPKIFQKIFFKKADDIIAVSEIIKKEYEKRSGRLIKLRGARASPFVESKLSKDELRKRYGFINNEKLILSLSSIKNIKGSDTLLYAFFDLGKNFINKYNLKLIYVGEGPMKPILVKKVKEKKFNEYVKFLGKIPHNEVPNIYKLVDIFVIPSLFEGRPQSLLDAMFNGLPIIGSDIDGIKNLIRHRKNGLLFEKSNIKDLTKQIKILIENEFLSKNLGKYAKKIVISKSFKFEYVIFQYIKIYKHIINNLNK